jgi:hypothetical protein
MSSSVTHANYPASFSEISEPAPLEFNTVTGSLATQAALTLATISRDKLRSSRLNDTKSWELANQKKELNELMADKILDQAGKEFAGAIASGTINCVGSIGLGGFTWWKNIRAPKKDLEEAAVSTSNLGSSDTGTPGLPSGAHFDQGPPGRRRADGQSQHGAEMPDRGQDGSANGGANPPRASSDAGADFNTGQAWIMIGQSALQAVESMGNMANQGCVFAGKFDAAEKQSLEGILSVLDAAGSHIDKSAQRDDQAVEKGLDAASGMIQNQPTINFA